MVRSEQGVKGRIGMDASVRGGARSYWAQDLAADRKKQAPGAPIRQATVAMPCDGLVSSTVEAGPPGLSHRKTSEAFSWLPSSIPNTIGGGGCVGASGSLAAGALETLLAGAFCLVTWL